MGTSISIRNRNPLFSINILKFTYYRTQLNRVHQLEASLFIGRLQALDVWNDIFAIMHFYSFYDISKPFN